jgi:hypothetical protein
MGENRNAYKVSVGVSRRDHWEDKDVGGRIIIKWILKRYDGVAWTGFIWLRIGTNMELL